ncbi:hypothetical protein D3C84_617020 [compost metagenome]
MLFHSFTGKYVSFDFVPTGYVYAGPHNVFALEQFSEFAVLQSSIHQVWAWRVGSTMRNDLRYSNKQVFETFAWPSSFSELECVGGSFHQKRHQLMSSKKIGLTGLLNQFHDGLDDSIEMQELRKLFAGMDLAVLASYGWSDIDLQHDFHEVGYLPEQDCIRFTISESARVEILRRLSSLNRQRYEVENAQGFNVGVATKQLPRASRDQGEPTPQQGLDFGDPIVTVASKSGDGSLASVILECLRGRSIWLAKSEILAATNLLDGQWNTAINDLIVRGLVERQGERRGARYRATTSVLEN